jgi:hypothetical protein
MKSILLIFLLLSMPQLIEAQDIYGSWVTDQYDNDFPGNYLDLITIIRKRSIHSAGSIFRQKISTWGTFLFCCVVVWQ